MGLKRGLEIWRVKKRKKVGRDSVSKGIHHKLTIAGRDRGISNRESLGTRLFVIVVCFVGLTLLGH